MTVMRVEPAVATVDERFMKGWEDTHMKMATLPGFDPFSHYEVVIAGLRNCGIGGFDCKRCNSEAKAADPTAINYVQGVAQAIEDGMNGVKL